MSKESKEATNEARDNNWLQQHTVQEEKTRGRAGKTREWTTRRVGIWELLKSEWKGKVICHQKREGATREGTRQPDTCQLIQEATRGSPEKAESHTQIVSR